MSDYKTLPWSMPYEARLMNQPVINAATYVREDGTRVKILFVPEDMFEDIQSGRIRLDE